MTRRLVWTAIAAFLVTFLAILASRTTFTSYTQTGVSNVGQLA